MKASAAGQPNAATAGPHREQEQSFTALVERHARLLYRVALQLLKNPQDAEDAVQETLLKLYRNGGWQTAENERAYLASAVWRTGLTRLGSASARVMRHAADVTAIDLASAGRSPEQLLADSEERALMRHLIEQLPEVLRQPLVLAAVEGLKSRDVAAILGIPEGTVRTRVLRARAQLRESFQAAAQRRERLARP